MQTKEEIEKLADDFVACRTGAGKQHLPFQIPEQPHQCDDGRDGENEFRYRLRIGEAVQREQVIQQVQCRNLQHDFSKNGKHYGKVRHSPRRNRVPYAMIASFFIKREVRSPALK